MRAARAGRDGRPATCLPGGDPVAAAKDYAGRLLAAERSAKDALTMQDQVDADQKAADEAKSTADGAKKALDDANHELAIKQAIDKAMSEAAPSHTVKHAAGTRLVGPALRSYAPKHMASQAATALPKTGDASVPVAPLAAVGFISLASAAGMRRRRRD